MESHDKKIVSEENKSNAYKELIKELEEELENKPKEIERLEIEYFKKYIELRPDTADSYQSLAEALLKKGNVDLALSNINKSLSLDNEYVPAIISLGEAFQAKGQKKEAKETYLRALSITQNEYYKKQAENKLKEVE